MRSKRSLSLAPASNGRALRVFAAISFALSVASATACESENALVESDDEDALVVIDMHAIVVALRDVPALEDESFVDFLQRARASLAASDDAGAQALARHIPDDTRAVPDSRYRTALPALLAAYARGLAHDARIAALSSFIRHETVNARDSASPGRSPAFDAFESDLAALTTKLGLAFDHVDHIAYEMTTKEKRHDEIGILVHADVVPAAENGWTVPPFQGVVKDGRIYGRGAIDDKGPLTAALFAVAALERSGVPFIRGFRLVAGTSEETHWADIERYQEVRAMPTLTFVADASFPIGVGEKGIATIRVTTTGDDVQPASFDPRAIRLVTLDGGQVANQVPASARAVLAVDDAERLSALVAAANAADTHVRALVEKDGRVVVEAMGRAAHSAEPEKGENAIAHLVRFLVGQGGLERSACGGLVQVLYDTVVTSPNGASFGIDDAHPRFTPTTVNLGRLVKESDGRCEAHLNIRWPPPLSVDDVVARVRSALTDASARVPSGPVALAVVGGGLSPTLIDGDTPLTGALAESYALVTGKPARLVTVSGTTYAKAVKGAVTFGPAPEDDGEARLHGPNEYLGLDELDALVEMYAFALARLAL